MYIYLEGIRFYAHHGVEPQETVVGACFILDLKLKTDFARAAQTDNLADTVNYAEVYALLKDEMSHTSKLLEHVCERIATRLFSHIPAIEEIHLRLSKENPPMRADCRNVGVEVHYIR